MSIDIFYIYADSYFASQIKRLGLIRPPHCKRSCCCHRSHIINRFKYPWGNEESGGISTIGSHRKCVCFFLVKDCCKSGDGAPLRPAVLHHKSHFPVLSHENLVSFICRPAIGDFELPTFISCSR